jgi:hypothetical protein
LRFSGRPFGIKLPFRKDQRQQPRTPLDMPVTLHWGDGQEARGRLLDLSASGTLLLAPVSFKVGNTLSLGVHLYDELREAAGTDYLRFELEVVEAETVDSQWYRLRCMNQSTPETEQFQRAAAVVERNEASRSE